MKYTTSIISLAMAMSSVSGFETTVYDQAVLTNTLDSIHTSIAMTSKSGIVSEDSICERGADQLCRCSTGKAFGSSCQVCDSAKSCGGPKTVCDRSGIMENGDLNGWCNVKNEKLSAWINGDMKLDLSYTEYGYAKLVAWRERKLTKTPVEKKVMVTHEDTTDGETRRRALRNGDEGFRYDPLFSCDAEQCTQMVNEETNEVTTSCDVVTACYANCDGGHFKQCNQLGMRLDEFTTMRKENQIDGKMVQTCTEGSCTLDFSYLADTLDLGVLDMGCKMAECRAL